MIHSPNHHQRPPDHRLQSHRKGKLSRNPFLFIHITHLISLMRLLIHLAVIRCSSPTIHIDLTYFYILYLYLSFLLLAFYWLNQIHLREDFLLIRIWFRKIKILCQNSTFFHLNCFLGFPICLCLFFFIFVLSRFS